MIQLLIALATRVVAYLFPPVPMAPGPLTEEEQMQRKIDALEHEIWDRVHS